ncbi:MAG: transposase [Bryobacteraceae bacterium]|nr:transposase [Bryobacteraceae bacterium]
MRFAEEDGGGTCFAERRLYTAESRLHTKARRLATVRAMANRPPRLERLFGEYRAPLWFVTFNTHRRAHLLANAALHERFRTFCAKAAERHIMVGRYVLMPDHAHLFVAGAPDFGLAAWVRMLKLSLSSVVPAPRPHWQAGFFDHLLRHDESYADKWEYVRQNPVRAGLVKTPEEWPYQGEFRALPFD